MHSYLLIATLLVISLFKNSKVSTENGINLNSTILFIDFNYSNQSVDIELANKNIITIDPGTFNGFSFLKTLNLNYNPLIRLNLSTFNGLKNLEGLSLASTLAHDDTSNISAVLFNGLENLASVNLASNNIKKLESNLFDGILSLKILDLKYNELSEIPVTLFSKLHQLEQLILQFNCISFLNSSHFEGLESLQVLDLSIK
jgi:Leucine-rich repeat (LRR) protein